MILYHGSNLAVSEPKIMISGRKLDFGIGFYLTSSREQAEKWARRTAERKATGKATVTVYDWPDRLPETLKVRIFSEPDGEWLDYVANNRKGLEEDSDYDVIIGPVANDQTITTVTLYLNGLLDMEAAIKALLPQKLKDQVVCKTEKALDLLTFREIVEL